MSLLKTLGREFDPRDDRVQYGVSGPRLDPNFSLYQQGKNIPLWVLNLGKTLIRGGIVGAGVGYLASQLGFCDTETGLRHGVNIGLGVDLLQYGTSTIIIPLVKDSIITTKETYHEILSDTRKFNSGRDKN